MQSANPAIRVVVTANFENKLLTSFDHPDGLVVDHQALGCHWWLLVGKGPNSPLSVNINVNDYKLIVYIIGKGRCELKISMPEKFFPIEKRDNQHCS